MNRRALQIKTWKKYVNTCLVVNANLMMVVMSYKKAEG